MKYRILGLILFISAFASDCLAFDISGRVLNEADSIPVQNADCSLFIDENPMAQTASGADGSFRFNLAERPSKDIVVKIKGVDFDEYSILITNPASDINVGDCYLIKTGNLGEVVVEGKQYVFNKGKYLITPPAATVASSTNALELISRLSIPGMLFNPVNRSITVNNGSPVILINGAPATQKQLNSIKASDVQNVEFTENVPLIYSNLGDSLINITLKKRNDGGSMTIDEIAGTAPSDDTYFYTSLHKGPSLFSASYNFSYRHKNKSFDTSESHFLDPRMPIDISQSIKSPFLYRMHTANLEYLYNPDKSIMFQARLSLDAYNSIRKQYSDYDDSLIGKYSSDGRSYMDNLTPNLDLFFSKSFKEKDNIVINMVGNYTNSDNLESILYENYPGLSEISNVIKSKRYSLFSIIQYSHQFSSKSILSASYQNKVSKTKNDYSQNDSRHRITENNNSIEAMYQQGIGPVWLGLRSGVRFFHTADSEIKNTQISNYTRFVASWAINDYLNMNTTFTYSPGNISLSDMIDSPLRNGAYTVSNGNPDLKRSNAINERLNLNFNKGIFHVNFSANYYHITNPVLFLYSYDDKDKCYISRPVNGKNEKWLYLGIFAGLTNLWNMFDIEGNFLYRHTSVRYGDWYDNTNTVDGSLSFRWHYKKWEISYQRLFPGWDRNGFNITADQSFDALSAGFRPINNMYIGLEWLFMFRNWSYESKVISPDYTNNFRREIRDDRNWIRLRFSYTFDFGSIFKTQTGRDINYRDNAQTFTRIIN